VYYAAGVPALEKLAAQTQFTTEANGGHAGLKAEFFDNADLSGTPGIERIVKKSLTIRAQAMASPPMIFRSAGRDISRLPLPGTIWYSHKAREKTAVIVCTSTRNW
jgi:hypothetical protein